MMKLQTSASFRAVAKAAVIMDIYLNVFLRKPSHTTILCWVKKIGIYQLKKEKEKSDDWVLIVDESIQIGQEKLLVILGIRLGQIDFTRPLKHGDLTPLCSRAASKWSADDISSIINGLKPEIGEVLYILSDCNSNLKKTAEVLEVGHIPDISHWFASVLRQIYQGEEEFKDMLQRMSQMRFRLCCSKAAHIIPPKQRTDSRFMNIKILTDWAAKAIRAYDRLDGDLSAENKIAKDELAWLAEKREFIAEISRIADTANRIMKILKHNGLSYSTIKECRAELAAFTDGRYALFAQKAQGYFDTVFERVKKQSLLITSDIIESAFGKYKNYLSCNKMAGITDLALCIPAFTFDLSQKDEIKKAIETVSVKDINQWGIDNIGKTLMTRRREMFVIN